MSVFTTPLGIFGAVEIGVLLSSLLYGATLVQTYIYALSCEKDRRAFKIIVFAIWSVSLCGNVSDEADEIC
jgi:hypothetical protein